MVQHYNPAAAPSTEVIRKVYPRTDRSHAISITSSSTGSILMKTADQESIEFYGKIDLEMSPEMAAKVGQALLDAAAQG